jgi:maltooligosyltrehalose trehalohydrolase
MWMKDYHFDGLRLDAVHEFIDRSAVHFMEQLSTEVKSLSTKLQRPLVLIAESDLNDPRILRSPECGGYGMDAQWSDDFHHALFTFIHPENGGKGYYGDFGTMKQLAKALTQNFVLDGSYSTYRERTHGRRADDLSPHQFLGYIQNHDQVGNRATGDRIAQIVGRDRTKVVAALVLTAPFIPMIFQGEEYAASTPFQYFADHEDPEMAKAVKAGRQAEFAAFGWDPDDIPDPESVETFRRSKLNWDEIHESEHQEMLDWYRSLIHLRRRSASLQEGTPAQTKVRFDETQRWLVMRRGLVEVVCNLGGSSRSFDLSERSSLLLTSHPQVEIVGNEIVLPSNSVAILSSENS